MLEELEPPFSCFSRCFSHCFALHFHCVLRRVACSDALLCATNQPQLLQVAACVASERFATALLAQAFSLRTISSLPSLSHAVQAVKVLLIIRLYNSFDL